MNGINSRLKDFLFAFQDMIGYAKGHKVEKIFVLGDIFHLKKNIPVQAFDQLWLYVWHARDIGWEFLAGNHDREDDRYDSVTITPFKQFGDVWTDPYVDKKNSTVLVPWLYDQAKVIKFMKDLGKKEFDLLLFHGEMEGALMGSSDYAMKSKVNEKTFGLNRFDRKFAGHLHKQQLIGGVHYPGSLIAKDFGETEHAKGFLHVVGKTVTNISVRYPKFITYHLNDWKESDLGRMVDAVKGNFVRVISEHPVDPSLVKRFENANPRILRFKLERAIDETKVAKPEAVGEKSWDSMVSSYCEQKGCPPELMDEYVNYGLKTLRGA